jgi:hypothetical protein
MLFDYADLLLIMFIAIADLYKIDSLADIFPVFIFSIPVYGFVRK